MAPASPAQPSDTPQSEAATSDVSATAGSSDYLGASPRNDERTAPSPGPAATGAPLARSDDPSAHAQVTSAAHESDRRKLGRVRELIPPASIALLTALFIFAGWFTLYGPINILAWRGGTFPPTEPDRPYYQQAIKDVARYQYDEQPDSSIYFGLACGASPDDLRAAIPRVGSHPDSNANPEADPAAAAAAAAFMPGASMSRTATDHAAATPRAGFGEKSSSGARNSRLSSNADSPAAEAGSDWRAIRPDLNSRLDAFGREVDCSNSWTAPFLSFLLASAGVPVYADPAIANASTEANAAEDTAGTRGPNDTPPVDSDRPSLTANPWLITSVEELMQAFKDHGAFFTDPSFSPQVGDIIFYQYPAGLGVHANMVVAVRDEWVTIGGDEMGKVGLASMTLRNRGGIIGYAATGLFEHAPLAAQS